jgi:L-alanine-DL-glutamate epimerase-like enolase superfamily enzyme
MDPVSGAVELADGGRLAWTSFHAPAAQPFRISRRTYTHFPLVQVCLDRDGRRGYGEAPPNRFYGETLATVHAVLPVLAEAVEDPWDWDGWRTRSSSALRGHPAARSAIECALLDWCGKEVGQPLWRLMGLSDLTVPPSSASLGISDPEVT